MSDAYNKVDAISSLAISRQCTHGALAESLINTINPSCLFITQAMLPVAKF